MQFTLILSPMKYLIKRSSVSPGIVCVVVVHLVMWPLVAVGAEVEEEVEGGVDEEDVVVVTAAAPLRESPSEAVMDRRAIDAAGARSAQDLLRSMSGIQLSQHGSEGKAAQFFIRGFDAAHGTDIAVGVDGLNLNEASHIHGHGYADTGLLIPEAVSSVRLRKGPYSLDQGSFSTAADVTYQLGVPESQRGMALGGETGFPRRGRIWAYDAPKGGAVEDVVAGEVVADEGPFANRQTQRAGLIGQRRFGDWTFRGAVQAAAFGLPGALPLADIEAGRIDRDQTYSPHTTGETRQGWVGVIYEGSKQRWSHRTSLDVRGRQFDGRENFTGYLLDAERGDEHRQYQRGLMTAVDHRTRWRLSDDWSLIGHLGGAVDRFRQFEDAIDDDGRAHQRERGGRGWQINGHVAPGLEGFIADRLKVEGGVRLESLWFDYQEERSVGGEHGRDALVVVAPRLRTSLFANENWTFVGAAGRGYRSPEARVFAGGTSAPADTDLRHHRGGEARITVVDAAEVGVIFEPRRELELSASAFGYFSDAEYIYDHVSRLDIDLGRTRRMGVETAARVDLTHHWRLQGHVTVVDARFVDDGQAIPFAPPLEAGMMGFGHWSNGVFAGLEWRGVGTRPLPFGAQAGPWSLVNAHLGRHWEGWEFRLDADNILDASWSEGVYHYASNFQRGETVTSIPSIHQVTGYPRMVRAAISYRW